MLSADGMDCYRLDVGGSLSARDRGSARYVSKGQFLLFDFSATIELTDPHGLDGECSVPS